MTTILIKSFFRPYLLDRCLYSIYHFVEGNFQIEVLDDGTPLKYLEKIQKKYPMVKISHSQYHPTKVKSIEEHLHLNIKYKNISIPTSFWLEKINFASSPILILTEDDVWFTRKINISELSNTMSKDNIEMVHLGYPPNHFNFTSSYQNNGELRYYKPKLIINSPKLYNLLLNNPYDITKFFIKTHLLKKTWKKQVWLLYNIPMGIYKKNYLSYIWKDTFHRVFESLQLKNAVTWYIKNLKKEKKYAIITPPAMKTTFISSASFNNTNQFDLIKFNHLLNEQWYHDRFNPLENFPEEISDAYIEKMLNEHSENLHYSDWKKWNNSFKTSFESMN